MKAAQVGATEAGNNWIGFVIHHAPGPMLAVLPDPVCEIWVQNAHRWITDDPLNFEETAGAAGEGEPQPAAGRGQFDCCRKKFPGGYSGG